MPDATPRTDASQISDLEKMTALLKIAFVRLGAVEKDIKTVREENAALLALVRADRARGE
jgi:hypothetical protein